ncbi:MAG: hypothetical protein GY868_03055 [Deltaproteobacteria bacterium]|nr:hypothetical protein [Deltaproteobacteria bacterium]
MAGSVIIYAPDSIRGMILLKTLELKNITARLCATHAEIDSALKHQPAELILFDTVSSFFDDIRYLKFLCADKPDIFKIILLDPQHASILKRASLRNCLEASEPFAPEQILTVVTEILDVKKKVFLSAA